MDKTEIIAELDKLMYIAEQLENTFFIGRLRAIQDALIKEWNESDVYFLQMQNALN